ncbi:MAG: hypothetical protein MI861_16625, partial [Pirellulales bacterium]|nr:hypothetical protein [Pirellulales bacterium]
GKGNVIYRQVVFIELSQAADINHGRMRAGPTRKDRGKFPTLKGSLSRCRAIPVVPIVLME